MASDSHESLVTASNSSAPAWTRSTETNLLSMDLSEDCWDKESSLAKAARIVQVAWRTVLNKLSVKALEAQVPKRKDVLLLLNLVHLGMPLKK